MIFLTTHADAKDAYRQKDLRQALYDEGDRLMHGVIVNLHGAEHLDRRRLENRLFRRDTFAFYERDVIPQIIGDILRPAIDDGRGDLLTLARRTMMTLSLDVAGVDRQIGTAAEIDRLYHLMDRLARASTVGHATGDTSVIIADGDAALVEFESEFFAASFERRRDLVAAVERGEADESALPRDVLTTLLRNQERLDLPYQTVLRETAYFPWVGSHSTSNQFVHAMHHMFDWLELDQAALPDDQRVTRQRLVDDRVLCQRFVHESMRLHPASPVSLRHALADVTLRSGVSLPAGSMVSISVHDANRDRSVFGVDADEFRPLRTLPDGVAPWGLSFGHGLHACLGQELAGGVEPAMDALEHHLLGSVAVMAGIALAAGARRDPDDPPARDTGTTRVVFGRYPVRFG